MEKNPELVRFRVQTTKVCIKNKECRKEQGGGTKLLQIGAKRRQINAQRSKSRFGVLSLEWERWSRGASRAVYARPSSDGPHGLALMGTRPAAVCMATPRGTRRSHDAHYGALTVGGPSSLAGQSCTL